MLEDAAARCGLVLSTSALGRYVRELFGTKPEPWIEIEGHAPPDGVTVTSQPIPEELVAPPVGSVDSALRRVTDLSMNVPDDDLSAARPRAPTASTIAAGVVVPLPRMAEPPAWTPPPPVVTRAPARARVRVPVVVWILGPAIVVGIVLGVMMSGRGADKTPAAPVEVARPAAIAIDAAVAAQTPPVAAIDAPAIAAAPVDAAVVAEGPSPAVDAGVPAPAARADVARVQAAIAGGDPTAIIEACDAVTDRVGGDLTRQCALAACHAHREVDAKRWARGVSPARRGELRAQCAAAGTPLEHAAPLALPPPLPPPPPRVDAGVDCAADPLACQH